MSVVATIEEVILKTIDIPSLPVIAVKVLKLTKDDRSSMNELERIINRDEAFSARILKIANSPYFGRSRDIDSISTAMMVIGFNNMQSLVLASALKDIYKKTSLFERGLWEHSLCVSIAASVLAHETRLAPSEEAHIAGLTHDLGCSVIYNSMTKEYSALMEKAYHDGIPLIQAENEVLGFNHCNAGQLIAKKWRLPVNMELVMAYHHKETIVNMPDSESEVNKNLCKIVSVADSLCFDMGIGMKNPERSSKTGLEEIGIHEDRLSEIKKEIEQHYLEQTEDIGF